MSGLTVRFWGTRGSIPTPGRHTEKYGGNTTCLEVRHGETVVVLDAGSGIRQLGGTALPYPRARVRFLLAACPALLAGRLGVRLSHRGPISPRLTRIDGVPALEFEFGRAGSRVALFVQSHTLRPVWLALSGQGAGSDLEPTVRSERVEPALQSAFKRRVRFA